MEVRPLEYAENHFYFCQVGTFLSRFEIDQSSLTEMGANRVSISQLLKGASVAPICLGGSTSES